MFVYVPCYENGRRRSAVIDTEKAKYILHPYGATINLYGLLYSGTHLYSCGEAVDAYWNKDHTAAEKHRVSADSCQWAAVVNNNRGER